MPIRKKPRTENIVVENCFYEPSPIEVKLIPLGECGLDIIVKATSDSGKTLVYLTIALEIIEIRETSLQVLIVAPTLQIANQIMRVATTIGRRVEGLNVGLFVGGHSYETDVQRFKNCHLAVGTPDHFKHLVEQNRLDLKTVKLFILDEADKLMTEEFQTDIKYLYGLMSEHKQFLAVSATMTNELNNFLDRYMYTSTVATP